MDLKNFNLIDWLFGQGGVGPTSGADPFRFYIPWLIINIALLLIPLYYGLEGRKRFFGHHTLNKWIADRFMNFLWPIGLVGLILEGARYANMAILGWRFWRYAWALWLAAFLGYWIVVLRDALPAAPGVVQSRAHQAAVHAEAQARQIRHHALRQSRDRST